MKRQRYSLSHQSHTVGHIGRLQTASIIPIRAGESIELTLDGLARLSAPRMNIVSECQVDVCAFFVPHRIVYGQDWVDFIKAGVNEVTTFTGIDIPSDYRSADYLCQSSTDATMNRAIVEGYNRIFRNFYSIPGYPYNADNALDNNQFDWFPTNEAGAENCRKYGRLCARPPHISNGATNVDSDGIPAWAPQDIASPQVYGGAGVLTTPTIARIAAQYKSTLENAFFNNKYGDILKDNFGGYASRDADIENQLPEFCMRETMMLSGKDVDGTDDATIGTYMGKTAGHIGMHMPRKHFGEHGNLWIMLLFRYPFIHCYEQHPLLGTVNWSYADISGNPDLVDKMPIETWNISKWFLNNVSTPGPNASLQQPYGQHYRFQNNRVHSTYANIPGFPMLKAGGNSVKQFYYYLDNEYFDTFQSPQMAQWQVNALINATKFSDFPGVKSSIFAGANMG